MEPFSLFQFLQSFLIQNAENTPKAQPTSANEQEQNLDAVASPIAKNNPETEAQATPGEENNQAFLSCFNFLR